MFHIAKQPQKLSWRLQRVLLSSTCRPSSQSLPLQQTVLVHDNHSFAGRRRKFTTRSIVSSFPFVYNTAQNARWLSTILPLISGPMHSDSTLSSPSPPPPPSSSTNSPTETNKPLTPMEIGLENEILRLLDQQKISQIENLLENIYQDSKATVRAFAVRQIFRHCLTMADTKAAPIIADAVLKQMTAFSRSKRLAQGNLDYDTFQLVIDIWAKHDMPNFMGRAMVLLDIWEDLYQQQLILFPPTSGVYHYIMHHLASQGNVEKTKRVFDRMNTDRHTNKSTTPTCTTWNILLNAYCHASNPEAVEQGLNQRISHFLDTGDRNLMPNEASYLIGIMAYSKEGRPEDAERMLERIHIDNQKGIDTAIPTSKHYCAVINAWAYSNRENAGERGEQILDHVANLDAKGIVKNVTPDSNMYSSVINAFASNGDWEGSKRMFSKMIGAYKEGNVSTRPNYRALSALLKALRNSNTPNAGDKAERLIDFMKNDYAVVLNKPAKSYLKRCRDKDKRNHKNDRVLPSRTHESNHKSISNASEATREHPATVQPS